MKRKLLLWIGIPIVAVTAGVAIYGSTRYRVEMPPELAFLRDYKPEMSRSKIYTWSGGKNTNYPSLTISLEAKPQAIARTLKRKFGNDPNWILRFPEVGGYSCQIDRKPLTSGPRRDQGSLQIKVFTNPLNDYISVSVTDYTRPCSPLEDWLDGLPWGR